MGLPMDPGLAEIHVPSGPTSAKYARPALDGLSLQELMKYKDNLEAELEALGSVLQTHGATMQTSLTTFDGFPRSDIDVAQVRTTRARIIHLRNDWQNVMDRIEKGLHEHFATNKQNEAAAPIPESTPTPIPRQATSSVPSVPSVPETPFARVNTVEPGSPAHEAGLKTGDRIRRFGLADWANHDNLKKVGQVVQQNLGQPILVRVIRGPAPSEQELELRLTPRKDWGGRGTLGCHILPI